MYSAYFSPHDIIAEKDPLYYAIVAESTVYYISVRELVQIIARRLPCLILVLNITSSSSGNLLSYSFIATGF